MIQILCIFLNLSSYAEPRDAHQIHDQLLAEFHVYLRNCPKHKFSLNILCLLIMIMSNLLLKFYYPRPSPSPQTPPERGPASRSVSDDFSIVSGASSRKDVYLKSFLRTLLLLVRQIMNRFGMEHSSRNDVESFLSIVLSTLNNFHSANVHILQTLFDLDKNFDQILTFLVNFFVKNDFRDARKMQSFLHFFCLLVSRSENIIKLSIRRNPEFFQKILSFLVPSDVYGILTEPKQLKFDFQDDHIVIHFKRHTSIRYSLANLHHLCDPLFSAPPRHEDPAPPHASNPLSNQVDFDSKKTPRKSKQEFWQKRPSEETPARDLRKPSEIR